MSEKRPKIQVGNEPPRPMTDTEYADYLAATERLAAEMPAPEMTAEEMIQQQAQKIAELEEALNLLLSGVTEDG